MFDQPVNMENEDDVFETQLLLGDRRSEKVADLFTQMFYRMLLTKP